MLAAGSGSRLCGWGEAGVGADRRENAGECLEKQLALDSAQAGPPSLRADPALKYLAKGVLT